MASDIKYSDLLLRFDDLVARSVIYYTPPKTAQVEDDGFALEFNICPSLLTKPPACGDHLSVQQHLGAKANPNGYLQRPPVGFGPGSDIANSDPGLLITVVRDTHLLIINKFCVFRPQLLLLTSDSYRRQREPLAVEDFVAACTVLNALEKELSPFVLYNCSSAAGASREHKHMQILPRPHRLFPDDRDFDPRTIPFRYFLRYLRDVDLGSANGYTVLFETYRALLAEAEQALGHIILQEGPDGGRYFPHNVALVNEWIIVIPRRSNNFEGVTANAAGMMGSVWLMDEAQLDCWKRVGPTRALAGLGVPMGHYHKEI